MPACTGTAQGEKILAKRTGRVQISIDVLCTLTQLYDVSADYILGLSDNRHPERKEDQGAV